MLVSEGPICKIYSMFFFFFFFSNLFGWHRMLSPFSQYHSSVSSWASREGAEFQSVEFLRYQGLNLGHPLPYRHQNNDAETVHALARSATRHPNLLDYLVENSRVWSQILDSKQKFSNSFLLIVFKNVENGDKKHFQPCFFYLSTCLDSNTHDNIRTKSRRMFVLVFK